MISKTWEFGTNRQAFDEAFADAIADRWKIKFDLSTGKLWMNDQVVDGSVPDARGPFQQAQKSTGLCGETIHTFVVRRWAMRWIDRGKEKFWDCRGRV